MGSASLVAPSMRRLSYANATSTLAAVAALVALIVALAAHGSQRVVTRTTTTPAPATAPAAAAPGPSQTTPSGGLVQKDATGQVSNLLTYDGDNNLIIGGSDPRVQNLFQMPVDLFKRHIEEDFLGDRLPPDWVAGHGPHGYIEPGAGTASGIEGVRLHANGDYASLRMPNTRDAVGYGSMAWFYGLDEQTSDQDVQLSLSAADTGGAFCRFHLNELTAPSQWTAQCSADGSPANTTSVDTGIPSDATRRLFVIDLRTPGEAVFWASDKPGLPAGQLIQVATITSDLPVGGGAPTFLSPFARVQSYGSRSDRTYLLDVFYGIRNR